MITVKYKNDKIILKVFNFDYNLLNQFQNL